MSMAHEVDFDESHYVPILKAKRGEFRAIDYLAQDVRNNMTPLFEIPFLQPFELEPSQKGKDPATIEGQIDKVAGYIQHYWYEGGESEGNSRPIFLDSRLLNITRCDDGRHPLVYLKDKLQGNGPEVIPVTGLNRKLSHHQAVRKVADAFDEGILLRLEKGDFDADLDSEINDLLRFFDTAISDTHLLLDLRSIEDDYQTFLKAAGMISLIPKLADWKTFTLGSAGFPNKFPVQGSNVRGITRSDWMLWKKLLSKDPSRKPAYADYGIRGCDQPEFPVPVTPAPKIAYTIDNEWVTIRRGGSGYDGFYDICDVIVSHNWYSGASFSYGDAELEDKHRNQNGPGNGETWTLISTNHHLAKAMSQISSFLAP